MVAAKKHVFLSALILASVINACLADQPLNREAQASAGARATSNEFIVVPGGTNAVQFRLYSDASPDAPHLFNTFEIEAHGNILLQSPGGDGLKRWLATSPSKTSPHNILINDAGPELSFTNGMTVIEQAAGPEWRYMAMDASRAYQGRLQEYKRAILFVEPDLFVLHDHLIAKEPVSFQMLLHPPAATSLDTNWGDLRVELPKAVLRIHAPGQKKALRSWRPVESAADSLLPGTVTMALSPTNKVSELDLLTVFAVWRGGEKKDYAFKLLENASAIGARIHRDGLPTLVAFKTDPVAMSVSLTGFKFSGPVGVDVFKPKRKAPYLDWVAPASRGW